MVSDVSSRLSREDLVLAVDVDVMLYYDSLQNSKMMGVGNGRRWREKEGERWKGDSLGEYLSLRGLSYLGYMNNA